MGEDRISYIIINTAKWILNEVKQTMVKLLFAILSVGPIPNHIAFIMDGNRRYAKKHKLKELGMGHKLGVVSLQTALEHCYQLGAKHITIYAFSIDNFKRRPEEVKALMELLTELMESMLEEDSIVSRNGVRVHIVGDLSLLDEYVRLSAERIMEGTCNNSNAELSVCIPYTSTDEITRAVREACEKSWSWDANEVGDNSRRVSLVDVERHMDVTSDPDIIIRTSGENRLSNFLLWQSARCLLYTTSAEWPEFGGGHLVWAILNFQRVHSYLEKKKKLL